MKNFKYEQITQPDNFKFDIGYTPLEHDFMMHTHEFSELVIIVSGTAIHQTDQGDYPITAGDVFVLNGDMAHGYKNPVGFHLCNIMYDPEQLLHQQDDLLSLAGYHALFVVQPLYHKHHAMHNLLHLSMHELELIRSTIDQMINEYERKTIGYASMIRAQFMQMVVSLSRLYTSHINERPQSTGQIAHALALIETHYHTPLTLDDIASASHISKTHLLRLFKETFGLSPIQYLIQLRIRKACQLLHHSQLSIADIAYQVGFEDSNYFSRQFKQVIGQSPRAYRKMS